MTDSFDMFWLTVGKRPNSLYAMLGESNRDFPASRSKGENRGAATRSSSFFLKKSIQNHPKTFNKPINLW